MRKLASLKNLLQKVHDNEDGVVSIETILIVGAIALPILIFLIVKAWPTIKNYFTKGIEDLQSGADAAASGS